MRSSTGRWVHVHVAVPRSYSRNGIHFRFSALAPRERGVTYWPRLHRFVYSAGNNLPVTQVDCCRVAGARGRKRGRSGTDRGQGDDEIPSDSLHDTASHQSHYAEPVSVDIVFRKA